MFVSSVSVYADFSTGPDESSPTASSTTLPLDEHAPDYEDYGPLKAPPRPRSTGLRRAHADRPPGSDRRPDDRRPLHLLGAPPRRAADPRAGAPERQAQFVDVRDLADWIVDGVEQGSSGRSTRRMTVSPGASSRGAQVTWVLDSSCRSARPGLDGAATLAARSRIGRMRDDRHRPRARRGFASALSRRRSPAPPTLRPGRVGLTPSARRSADGVARAVTRSPTPAATAHTALPRARALSGRGRRGAAVLLRRRRRRRVRAGSRAVCSRSRARSPARSRRAHELLVDSGASVTAQAILPIRHFLVGVAEVPLDEIRIVRSHPVALDSAAPARLAAEGGRGRVGHHGRRRCTGRARRSPDRGRDRERARRPGSAASSYSSTT